MTSEVSSGKASSQECKPISPPRSDNKSNSNGDNKDNNSDNK